MDITNKVTVITGAGSGLGAETAHFLAARGARVAIVDLNIEAARRVADECGGFAIACDVADAASAEAAIDRIAREVGLPQILVNCAGIAPAARIVGRNGPMALADYEKVIRVNLIGTFNMMRLVAAQAAGTEPNDEGERGVIISTASVAAYEGQIGQAAYASSKAGVVGLTLPAARELASVGIRVCTIAPGIIGTPMLLAMPQEVQKSLGASIPFPSRLGRPEEYAMLVHAIVENPLLNGETIRLDGAVRLAPK